MKFKCILTRVTTTRRDDSNYFELQKDTTRRCDATTRRDECSQAITTRRRDGTTRRDGATERCSQGSRRDATGRDELQRERRRDGTSVARPL